MSKYTSNEKLSEKKMSSSTRKKTLALLFSGVVTFSTLAGTLYAAFGDRLDNSKELKDFQMPFKISQGTHNEPSYARLMNENNEKIEVIKRNIIRYQELLQMPNHSDRHEKEIDNLVNKIVGEYGHSIESFSLEAAKSKLADANHISTQDIKVGGSVLEQKFVARDIENNKVLLTQDSPHLVSDVLMRLINLQNNKTDSDFDKKLHANRLSMLLGKTLEMGNKTYHISKDNKLVEIDMNDREINKSDDGYAR